MELKWFEDFVTLARCLNFSRAASERHVTQSALSRRIRLLEQRLGFPLVDRTTHPVGLTREGLAFLPKAREILSTLQRTRVELGSIDDGQPCVINFAALNTLCLTFFPPWFAGLQQGHPALQVRFCDPRPSFAGTVSTLIEGESDLMLTYAHPWVAPGDILPRCPSVSLGVEWLVPVSRLDQAGRPLHPIDAEGAIRYLGYRQGAFFAQLLVRLFERQPLELVTVYENTMSSALKGMVMAGSGLAWLPESLVRTELDAGLLGLAGDAHWHQKVEIRLYRSPRPLGRGIEQLWEEIVGGSALPARKSSDHLLVRV
ncbi:LysR family transcriptional regulator [Halotalea alkalilenta]|uniref:LysR family transcriptional regulator n=1 Tax=Halotalea alkalilenta TaxID=376489 RepID=UPI000693FEB5|nr:LysR family transcriptional regulator [Halotalea alkalilenta]